MIIDIWHNIVWSKYKGAVFSELDVESKRAKADLKLNFFQIAETERQRRGLSSIDLSYHKYKYQLLFNGAYEDVPFFKLIYSIAKLTATSKADLVIISGYSRPENWVQLFILILKRKYRGVFCDSTAFDRPRSTFKSFLKGIFFRYCDLVFCYGVRSREYVKSFGVDEKRIIIRCQAAALPRDYDVKQVIAQRAMKASKEPIFLYVGRLSAEKNLECLLAAFSLTKKAIPTARLRLVGDGPQKEKLQNLAYLRGVSESVNFLGSVGSEAIFEEYISATCFVLPSLSEPWGLVVNEALSYGCPVVVSNRCGCVPELVLDNCTGFVFDATSVEDLAEKLKLACIQFSDVTNTTKKCLDVVSTYSAKQAAKEIYEGCKSFLEGGQTAGLLTKHALISRSRN